MKELFSCDILEVEKMIYATPCGYEGAAGADRSYDRLLTLEQIFDTYKGFQVYRVEGAKCTKIESAGGSDTK